MARLQGTFRPVAEIDYERFPEFRTLVDHWERSEADLLCDLESGPLAEHAADLVVLEQLEDGEFLYLHYGLKVSGGSGLSMKGKKTSDFSSDIGRLFADSYRQALAHGVPFLSVNKAKASHFTHSWQRLVLPLPAREDGGPARVIALVRPVAYFEAILGDFARDTGFLGGTIEPVVEDGMVTDFVLLTLSATEGVFGVSNIDTLGALYGRALAYSEIDAILSARDGDTAINRLVPDSKARFGRVFVLKVTGGDHQPVFSLTDATELVRAREVAEERKAVMEDFAQTASDWMWESDADHRMTMLTQAVEAQLGHPPSHFVGRSRFGFADLPENAAIFAEHRKDIDARRPFRDLIYKIKAADGSDRWLRVNGKPRFDAADVFLGYRGTGSNITAEVEAREQAARRADDLAEAHRVGRLGGWSFNVASRLVTLSPEYLALVGLPTDCAVMPVDRALRCFSSASRGAVQRAFAHVMRTREKASVDVQWLEGRAQSLDLNVIARPRLDGHGRVREIVGTVQDITERKANERALETLAFHDPLTGLGNRSYFSRELDGVIGKVKQCARMAGLLLLDLDHFKEVNDSLGHAAGDELLRRVGERLSMSVAGHGSVFRLGGDEFAIIVPQVRTAGELGALSTTILSAFAGTVKLMEGAVHISASIGMVMLPQQAGSGEEAMRFADLALYEAKSAGRTRAVLFHEGLDQDVQDRVNLARDLRKAIRDDKLHVHYQVQVDVMSGRIDGFEALARWDHPQRGPIPPAKFIPIAESSHLIADLGAWMVRRVCREGRAWLDAGGARLPMAVNLSVAQLWHRDVQSDIRQALEETGFPPELLCVELTESVFGHDTMPRIQRLFAALKGMGVQIALDDFGTGYSSLQYLSDLSFDKLKIDRSFIVQCDRDDAKRRLLTGIVGLAKGLGLTIVVEGVETEAELQVVCDLGCNVVQGFFFGRPRVFHEACLDAAQIEADYSFKPILWKDRAARGPVLPLTRRVRA